MKSKVRIIMILALTILLFTISASAETGGKACAVMEASTGRILYSNNMDQQLPMASKAGNSYCGNRKRQS